MLHRVLDAVQSLLEPRLRIVGLLLGRKRGAGRKHERRQSEQEQGGRMGPPTAFGVRAHRVSLAEFGDPTLNARLPPGNDFFRGNSRKGPGRPVQRGHGPLGRGHRSEARLGGPAPRFRGHHPLYVADRVDGPDLLILDRHTERLLGQKQDLEHRERVK